MRNPAAVQGLLLYACGARMTRDAGLSRHDCPMLPDTLWRAIFTPLPYEIRLAGIIVGLDVIMAGLVDRADEVPA